MIQIIESRLGRFPAAWSVSLQAVVRSEGEIP